MAKFDMRAYLNKSSQPKQKAQEEVNNSVKMISVYDLVPNPQNFYELNDIDKLEMAIEIQGGITTSLEVKAVENNKYMLIAGHRRRQAMINLLERESEKINSDKVPCIVKEFETPEQEIVALIFSNKYQRVRSKSEELKEFQLLKPILKNIYDEQKAEGNINGRFRKFCAEFFDVSESTIHRIESMEKLSPEIKQELEQGNITPTAASELTMLSPAEQKAVYEDTTKNQGAATVKSVQDKKKEIIIVNTDNAMSEIEIKVHAANEVRNILLKSLDKINVGGNEVLSIESAKVEMLKLLLQVVENELENLTG